MFDEVKLNSVNAADVEKELEILKQLLAGAEKETDKKQLEADILQLREWLNE